MAFLIKSLNPPFKPIPTGLGDAWALALVNNRPLALVSNLSGKLSKNVFGTWALGNWTLMVVEGGGWAKIGR